MKKALFSFIAVLIISVSCFVVPASADDSIIFPDLNSSIYTISDGSYTSYLIPSSFGSNLSLSVNSVVIPVFYDSDFIYLCYGGAGLNSGGYLNTSNSGKRDGLYLSIDGSEYIKTDISDTSLCISAIQNSSSKKSYKSIGGVYKRICISTSIVSDFSGSFSSLFDLSFGYLISPNCNGDSHFNNSYYPCKMFFSSENFILTENSSSTSSDTTSTAEIMTAPQSETDKADGGHLKVSQSQAANGYTAFSFMLNDNSNYHNYSVKISSNTNQLGTIEQRILNENGGSIDTGSETLSDIASVSNWLNTMFHVWSENIVAMQHFDFEYMFNQNAQTDSALKNLNKSWLSSMCKNMNSLTYSTAKVLTCDELSFTDEKLPYLPCKVVSFALSDYINVNKDTIYKVEIIDNVTQTVLDYTYIATPVAMAKGAENYGIKVYSYKDYETMKNDVLNNDPSNAYTSNTGDKLEDSDPDNGFNSGTIQGIYDEYSINDLSDALSQSVSNATGFVKMCTSLIPPEIMALIVGGIALLVLLRVLGR